LIYRFLEFTHLDPNAYTSNYSKICAQCEAQLLKTYEFRSSLLTVELTFAKKTKIEDLLTVAHKGNTNIGSFALPAGLKLELRKASPPQDDMPMIPCSRCQETFPTHKKLFVHMRKSHVFRCGERDCEEVFKTKSLLQFHLYQHREQEKRLVCSTCGKRYDTEEMFALHRQAHNETPAVPCEECSKTFVLVQALVHHRRAEHPEKKCKLCARSFNAGRDLKLHMLQHAGTKFKCDLCDGTEFADHVDLLDHLREHPDGPIKFDESRHIVMPGKLRKKMDIAKTGDFPFSCAVCKQTFESLKQQEEHEKLAESVSLDDPGLTWQPVQDSIVVLDPSDVDVDLIVGIIENMDK
jgi:Zinc finger, C2H2 type